MMIGWRISRMFRGDSTQNWGRAPREATRTGTADFRDPVEGAGRRPRGNRGVNLSGGSGLGFPNRFGDGKTRGHVVLPRPQPDPPSARSYRRVVKGMGEGAML